MKIDTCAKKKKKHQYQKLLFMNASLDTGGKIIQQIQKM